MGPHSASYDDLTKVMLQIQMGALPFGTNPHAKMASAKCSTCEASYQVVRVEAQPTFDEKQLLCPGCGAPLRNREGKYALKYFRSNGKPLAVNLPSLV